MYCPRVITKVQNGVAPPRNNNTACSVQRAQRCEGLIIAACSFIFIIVILIIFCERFYEMGLPFYTTISCVISFCQ